MSITIELTPDEVIILQQGIRKITEFADRSTIISDALGIETRHRKKLRDIAQRIYNLGKQQARISKLA